MPFPNSPNIVISLLKATKEREKYQITNLRKTIGIARSLTREEWKASVETKVNIDYKVSINAFLYQNEKFVMIGEHFYKIERTFVGGQFVELYLSDTRLTKEDFYGWHNYE